MAICPTCGQETPEGFPRCANCGAALESPAPAREERKVVTVLFCDLVGFTSRAETLDPEEVRALQAPYWSRVRSELEAYGGTVEKFIGDAVMALFGAPIAHEDDPERAVRAALAIRDSLEDELQVRIGITTGEALVSLGARPGEGEGMASGDVVNTAARLQAAAPENGILVDETTYRATERAISYREADAVKAKGKAEPVAAWEADEARARFGVDVVEEAGTLLVGRRREVELLAGALARVRAEREPQLVTLVGVPGIGKSRLVYELLRIVDDDEELIAWRQGRSLPYGEGVSFWALAEMVKAQAGVLESDSEHEAGEKLAHAVRALVAPEDADWVERHLCPLVGLDPGSEAEADRRGEAFAAWRRFLEALAETGPTVLVFEDLHWAEEGLLDFVEHLIDWVRGVPLLVVCTGRPELFTKRPGWGGGTPNAATISLSPLSEEETSALVRSLLDIESLPPPVQAALLERAGGNPLYAEEFARAVLQRGGEGAPELSLPESVQGLIAARLDALASDEKQLLQDAAVVGKVFWLGALLGMNGHERANAEQLLHGLERKEFVRRERRASVAGESEYAFRHLLLRDVAYGQIPRAARAQKHRLAAEWIEAMGRPEDHAEMLAHHYSVALEYARAAGVHTDELASRAHTALVAAGDRAASLYASASAVRLYREALRSWPDSQARAERARMLLRYGTALLHAEGSGEEALREARGELFAVGDDEHAAEAELLLGQLAWRQGRADDAVHHQERARLLLADTPPSAAKASLYDHVSRNLMLAGESEQAIEAATEAFRLAETFGLEEIRGTALMTIGDSRLELADFDGMEQYEEGLEIVKRLNSPERARGAINLADHAIDFGDVERGLQLRAEAFAVGERTGEWVAVSWCRGLSPEEQYWKGRWQEALQQAEAFITESEAGTGHYLESACRIVRGHILLAMGDEQEAEREGGRALELARSAKDPQALYPALAFAARACSETRPATAAAETAAEVIETVRGIEKAPLGYSWMFDLGHAFARLRRGDELIDALSRVKKHTPWLAAARLVASGEYVEAAQLYAERGVLPYEALTRLHAGGEHTERAVAFYRSVGATAYVREGEALLAASA